MTSRHMIVDTSCKSVCMYIYIHVHMHCMSYIYNYTTHLFGAKKYYCISCHRFSDGIRDNDQQVLPCSVLSIPSMVWGALAQSIPFSDGQLDSFFTAVVNGQIYKLYICIYICIILAFLQKKQQLEM